jgi:hypothetical protein
MWLILAGLGNYLAYGISYAFLQGDAKNGYVEVAAHEAGRTHVTYFVGGHFIRHGATGKFSEVTRGQWIYSYIHSISLWATHAVVLLSMLTLARPHIIGTMRDNTLVGGPTFITVIATLVIIMSGAATTWFLLEFLSELHKR